MKKKCKRAVSCFLFVMCGLILFLQISEILRRKSGAESDMVHSFYEIEKNTLDVLCLGSSHLYYGVQPNVLWRDYGITAYDMGSSEQTAASSYFLLKEAFQYQKPKVVVLESYYLWYNGLYNGEARLRQAFDGMRFGPVKLEMIDTMLADKGKKEQLSYCLPFLKYHSRWNALQNQDFHTKSYLKGARIDYTAVELENPGIPDQVSEVPEISLTYLEKIAALCEENGADFVVLAIPFGIETDGERYERRQGLNVALEEYLAQREIPFLFCQKQEPDLIAFDSDFRDKTHLNTAGAEKLTKWLGAWLQETYQLSGHHGDAGYSSWDADLAKYEADAAKEQENPTDTADDAEG